MAGARPHSTRNLALVVAVLAVLALLPTRLTWWVSWARGPFMTVVAPVSGPASALGGWLHPEEWSARSEADAPEAEMLRQREALELAYNRALDRIVELEGEVRDLQEGVEFQPEIPIARLTVTRIGSNLAGGTIDVSRGTRDGVTTGSVAVARRSQQLVGIVSSVGPVVSTVHLITDTRVNPGLAIGVVMPKQMVGTPDEFVSLVKIQLRPEGDGTLVADEVGVGEANRIEPGLRVRLSDETWPGAASMLVLGRVWKIEDTEEPLFKRVVVKPEVDPQTVRGMILNIPRDDPGARKGNGR